MAGNVDFTLAGGSLFITGDGDANGLQIRQVAPNSFALIGVKQGSGNTTVQGAGFKIVNGVTGDVFMNMNGGNDAVRVEDGEGTFATQAGLPLTFQLPKFERSMFVNLGAGADTFVTDGMKVLGRLNIDGGFGNDVDVVTLEDTKVEATNTAGLALDIRTQGGNDQVRIINGNMLGFTSIDAGSEDDLLDIDRLFVQDADFEIRMQNGNDNVDIFNLVAHQDVLIDTGFGQDFVNLVDLLVINKLQVELGGDSDILQVEEITASSAEFDGGLGTDALIDQGDIAIKSLLKQNFEIEV